MKKTTIILLITIAILSISAIVFRMIDNNRIKNILNKMNLKYFTYNEFDSPAVQGVDDSDDIYSRNGRTYLKDSGIKNMQPETLRKLDDARDIIEKEWNKDNPNKKIVFRVNSGYRTPHYNEYLGGQGYPIAVNSDHIRGYAADISLAGYTDEQIEIAFNALRRAGFNRFGLGQSYVHVDDAPERDINSVWNYGSNSINIDPLTA